jgi:diguanylate cyclase (GGDEF)-like protein/PAS domain S-box-containing protein
VTSWTEDGKPLWMMGTHHDVTERKLTEEALSESHENLRVHQIELETQNDELRRTQWQLDTERARYFDLWDLAPVGYVTVSETGLILQANLAAVSLLAVPRTLLVRRPLSQFFLKQDHDSYYLHQRQLLETGEPQSYELRMAKDADPPGVMWVRLEATIAQEKTGASADYRGPDERRKSPRRVIRIVLSDISERKQAEAALRESEEKYRTVADFTYDWEAWRGPDGTTRYISPSCERISGHTVAEFIADPHLLIKIAHPDDRSRVSEHYFMLDVEAQGQDVEIDFRILTAQGETRWISHCCTAVYGRDGRWLGRRESNRDITARKESEDKIGLLNTDLDRLAHMDEMTGIHNRRSILLLAEHEFNVAMRYRPPLSVLFFDIDYFKQINDTFGHALGDQALKQIVQVARAEIRSADVLGRYGGDEFIVLLPQTGVQEALPLAERIRARIADLRIDSEKGPLALTISMGIAQTIHRVLDPGDIPPAAADTAEKLIQRADQALYAAKQAGRNRTMIYDPDKTGAN